MRKNLRHPRAKRGLDQRTWQQQLDDFFAEQQQPMQFPAAVQTQVRRMPDEPTAKDCRGRRDLTKLPLCTIDDETAQDFDDAVYGEAVDQQLRVVVAIADVSHYVKPDTLLDTQAQKRAFSLYYPANCIPMLPHKLSAGLCSLKPDVTRLCVAVDMQIDAHGHIYKVDLYRAFMRSHARLTYKQVQQWIQPQGQPKQGSIPKTVTKSLTVLLQVSRLLRQIRQDKGSLRLHVPQHTVRLNASGQPASIDETPRIEAYQLIEDLMIAANESVARLAVRKKIPCLFRVHPAPKKEKLAQFVVIAQSLGAIASSLKFKPEQVTNRSLTRLHEHIIGKPLQGMLDPLLLRCMMQASYSNQNTGHFGLASGCYAHFTSPIRRYPDLMVHRFLLSHIPPTAAASTKKLKLPTADQLQELAQHCNQREREIMDTERQLISMHQAWVMQQYIAKTDSAVVVGCSAIGLFMQLKSFGATGLLPISKMGKRRIAFDAIRLRLIETATGHCIQMGDKLRVRIAGVHVSKGHVDLLPVRPVTCLRDLHVQSVQNQ